MEIDFQKGGGLAPAIIQDERTGEVLMLGGLSAADFVKCISVQSISRRGFARLADDVQALARAEGLPAHAAAVEVRR